MEDQTIPAQPVLRPQVIETSGAMLMVRVGFDGHIVLYADPRLSKEKIRFILERLHEDSEHFEV